MRAPELAPLFTSVLGLKGVGDKTAIGLRKLLGFQPNALAENKAAVPSIRDLLFHLPSGLVDRRHVSQIAECEDGKMATVLVKVVKHSAVLRNSRKRIPFRVEVMDNSGAMTLVFFQGKHDYWSKQLPLEQERIVSGVVTESKGKLQMVHPELMVEPSKAKEVLRLEMQYPLTYGIGQRVVQKLMRQAVGKLPALPEWLDGEMRKQRHWPDWKQAMQLVHFPKDKDNHDAFLRLAYDEILANQLALAMVRSQSTQKKGQVIAASKRLRSVLLDSLPFQLTHGQQQVIGEMDDDLQSGNRMLRLLQGDVGSGKTLVSVMVMLSAIEAGGQCALMVPTELLGRQHYESIVKLLTPLKLRVAFLSGKMPKQEKTAVQAEIAAGTVDVVIGTHALFQDDVQFKALALVVIDEQHRFGVNQRLALTAKGVEPHVLLMTATPIPRTLTMTAYGDMESSLLLEKPAGRQEIQTKAVSLDRIDEVVTGLKRAIADGSRVYWVCPLVEEKEESDVFSEEGDLAAAEERYRVFKEIFGECVALVHGKMKPAEREPEMQRFVQGEADILVATTVIEVGVNVPEATIMVIEHAERFGLSQLHQLRGRVGRGDKASSCILLYNPCCSDTSKQRLRVIRETNDGFRIAEEDLMLRGAGDVLGTRQSGLPNFRFVNLAEHRDLVLAAKDDVKLILHKDAALASERGRALRLLLQLFSYDESVLYRQAG